MANVAPFEIIAAPFLVYIAATGETFPDVDAAPAGNWVELSTQEGGKNIDEDGVTIALPQTVEFFRGNGSTVYLKAFRTEEEVRVSFNLADLTFEALSYALNGNTVTDTAPGVGTIGTRSVKLYRGPNVTQHALLVRGVSPYGNFNLQMELPVVVMAAETEIAITKGEPGRIPFEFVAMNDPDAATEADVVGRLIAQDAVATPE